MSSLFLSWLFLCSCRYHHLLVVVVKPPFQTLIYGTPQSGKSAISMSAFPSLPIPAPLRYPTSTPSPSPLTLFIALVHQAVYRARCRPGENQSGFLTYSTVPTNHDYHIAIPFRPITRLEGLAISNHLDQSGLVLPCARRFVAPANGKGSLSF